MQTLTAERTTVKSSWTPSPSPLTAAAVRISQRHPHLSNMAYHALAIAEAGKVYPLSITRVFVKSEKSNREYRLDFDANTGWRCNCPAFAYRPAVINGRHYCKHIMAMAIAARGGR